MSLVSTVISSLLTASIILNAALIIKFTKQSKSPPKSLELQDFISDLSRGEGLIRMSRVDPADVILRSPRTMR